MSKKKTSAINPYSKKYDKNQLEDIRRKLAKRANQRLLRLERATSDISDKKFTYGAYDIAQTYLAKEKPRFKESFYKDGKTQKEIADEIAVLQKFINAESSTVGGQRKIEKRRIETLKAAGISEQTAKTKAFYDFLSSSTFEELSKAFDSEKIVEMFDLAIKQDKKPNEIIKTFEEFIETKERVGWKDLIEKIDAIEIPNSNN